MNLILITKTPMVEKIFSLVCHKLALEIEIKNSVNIETNSDIIMVDEEFIDDNFNSLKQFTKKLGVIVSEELPLQKSRDFILHRPFLPKTLEKLLNEQIKYIQEEKEESLESPNSEEKIVANYVQSLVHDEACDIEEDNDESIVTLNSLKDGGVLDSLELNKIGNILKDDDTQNEMMIDENDYKDISEIIDDALDEIKEYEFELEENTKEAPIKLVINNYNIDELKPFLQKFDQNVINRLSSGEDINIALCLKANK